MTGELELDIIAVLAEGEMREEELVERTGVTREALRRESNRLEEEGIVEVHRAEDDGRIYQLSPAFRRVAGGYDLVDAEAE